jgi:hypothetical protein
MVALCVGGAAVAQELPEQDCGDLCVCVFDVTCTDVTGCDPNGEGCESTGFWVDCVAGGTYKLELVLVCPTGCQSCFACAEVTGDGGNIFQVGCVTQSCSYFTTLALSGGSHTLRACLRSCPGQSCAQCTGCTAEARLYQTIDDCTTPCNW